MDIDELMAQAERGIKQDLELANSFSEKRTAWLRYLVQTISVVFGVLVGLGGGSSGAAQTRFCFAAAVCLLALSILSLGGGLFAEIYYLRRGRHLHAEETKKAFRERRPQEPVGVQPLKIFAICEVAGYICFGLALLALCVYVFLQAMYP